eukprot:CAMPEP_0204184440 /NCGR_PEP_ID=MMETSP0361-20130328/54448_1 /ASSEMBLY_ACC=CAM_ASM_000343 /TAXON_ID=268821 /ORGANISM="Scrippsiella Hangoei, Strain SHTV-5" /LENGTH=115 /DNA_ID=CAMNT_0051144473 /DNA_START=14 /DNA_END=357 /DNA_ORIENTATION=-
MPRPLPSLMPRPLPSHVFDIDAVLGPAPAELARPRGASHARRTSDLSPSACSYHRAGICDIDIILDGFAQTSEKQHVTNPESILGWLRADRGKEDRSLAKMKTSSCPPQRRKIAS